MKIRTLKVFLRAGKAGFAPTYTRRNASFHGKFSLQQNPMRDWLGCIEGLWRSFSSTPTSGQTPGFLELRNQRQGVDAVTVPLSTEDGEPRSLSKAEGPSANRPALSPRADSAQLDLGVRPARSPPPNSLSSPLTLTSPVKDTLGSRETLPCSLHAQSCLLEAPERRGTPWPVSVLVCVHSHICMCHCAYT